MTPPNSPSAQPEADNWSTDASSHVRRTKTQVDGILPSHASENDTLKTIQRSAKRKSTPKAPVWLKPSKSTIKQDTRFERSFLRQSAYSSRRARLRYGELPPEHPAYEYIRSIYRELYPLEKECPVRIIPERYGVNAFALPGGLIGITSTFLRFAESREAIAGAIAHEHVHIQSEHAKKRAKAKSEREVESIGDIVYAGLKSLSRWRLAEYESDLRAAMIDMEKAGINPLGFKILLQKLGEKEQDKGRYSDTHGSSMDRALQIATWSYIFDLRSLSNHLSPIPEDILDSLDNVELAPTRAIFSRPGDFTGFIVPLAQRQQERKTAIENLTEPIDQLIALRTIMSQSRAASKSGRLDEHDAECTKYLIGKISAYLDTKVVSGNRVAKIMLINYFSGIDSEVIDTYLEQEDWPRTMSAVMKTLREAKESGVFPYQISTGDKRDVLSFLQKKNLIKDTDMPVLERLDEIYDALDEEFEIETSKRKESFVKSMTVIFRIRPSALSGRAAADVSTFWQNEKDSADSDAMKICEKNFGNLAILKIVDAIPNVVADIEKKVKGLSPRETVYFLSQINESIGIVMAWFFSELNSFSFIRDSMTFNICYEVLKNLTTFKNKKEREWCILSLYQVCTVGKQVNKIKASPDYGRGQNEITQRMDEELMRRDVDDMYKTQGDDLGLIIHELKREERELRSLAKRERKMSEAMIIKKLLPTMAGYRDKLEKKSTLNISTREDLFIAYRVWVDDEFGINSLTTDGATPDWNSISVEFFCKNFDLFCQDKSISEIAVLTEWMRSEKPDSIENLYEGAGFLGNILEKIADATKDKSIWQLPFQEIAILLKFINDPFLRLEFSTQAIEAYWDTFSFDEKVSLLFTRENDIVVSDFALREKFFCEEVKTEVQYRKVKEVIEHSIDDVFGSSSAMGGAMVLLDRLNLKYNDPIKLIRSALTTSQDDFALRDWVYGVLTQNEPGRIILRKSRKDELDRDMMTQEEAKELEEAQEFALDKFMQSIYALDGIGRRMLVRKLLVGSAGILFSPDQKKEFFDSIFDIWLEDEKTQDDLSEVLQNIKEALIDEPSWELIYFSIQGILADKLFIPPANTADILQRKQHSKHTDKKILYWEHTLRGALGIDAKQKLRKQKIKPIEFVKEIAGSLGALGRRFLQVLPQFVQLSSEYEQEFSDVYDKVKWQSKFAALATVVREWPEIWTELSEVGDRIGGGSMVSVFEARNVNGRKEVLKVRNPNILYHLEESDKVVTSVSGRLSEKHGGAYDQINTMIPDIDHWIRSDIEFSDFLEKDADFRTKYAGFSSGINPYKIRIPESYGPPNPYFSREEYIKGTNLTSLDAIMADPKHDAKAAVSLLVKFFVQQLRDGRVHSDVHPGNYAVTADRELVMYDRNFYLDYNDQEKSAILWLLAPFAPREGKIKNIMDLFQAKKEAEPQVAEFVDALGKGDIYTAKKKIVEIKTTGTHVPLKITLLLKNIWVLNWLAKKVGYSSILSAFLG